MTVKLKQREIDKDTLEQHTYIKYEVRSISTYHDGRYTYVRLVNSKSQVSTFNLEFYDVECCYI